MSTPLKLKVLYGAWERSVDGQWTFHRRPSDLGYNVLVSPTVAFDSFEKLIRERYNLNSGTPMVMAYHQPDVFLGVNGTRTPPVIVSSSATVQEMLDIRAWFDEVKLCLTTGAEAVAHFQFLMNTPFSMPGNRIL